MDKKHKPESLDDIIRSTKFPKVPLTTAERLVAHTAQVIFLLSPVPLSSGQGPKHAALPH